MCRLIAHALALAILPLLVAAALPQAGGEKPDADKVRQQVRKLIQQLDDDSSDTREEATRRLEEIGDPALSLLQEAAEKGAGAEVRLRARAVIRAIEKRSFGEVTRWDGHKPGEPTGWASRSALAPDGTQVLVACGEGIRVWDAKTGKAVRTLGTPEQGAAWALSVSADGKRAISAGNDQIVHVWDLKAGKEIVALRGHTSSVSGAVLSRDGKQAVSGGWDRTLRLWDVDAGKQVKLFDGVKENVPCLALSPDGKLLAAGQFDDQARGIVRLWDFATGKELRAMTGHEAEISTVAFSPDGKQLLSASFDKTVRLWDVATGKELKRLEGHTARVEAAAFTPDGKRVISAGDESDSSVRVWDVASGKQLYSAESAAGGFLSVVALPGGKQFLTTAKDGSVRLWRMAK